MIHVCAVASDGGPTDQRANARESKIEVCGEPSNVQPGISSKEAQFITRNACACRTMAMGKLSAQR